MHGKRLADRDAKKYDDFPNFGCASISTLRFNIDKQQHCYDDAMELTDLTLYYSAN